MKKEVPDFMDEMTLEQAYHRLFEMGGILSKSDIRVDIGEDDIVLRKNTGDSLSLGSYLFSDTKFYPSSMCQYNTIDLLLGKGEARVLFDQHKTDSAVFILTLLHEIGHSRDENLHGRVMDMTQDFGSQITFCFSVCRNLCSMILDVTLTARPSVQELMDIFRQERYAWAWALKILRKLEADGWDVRCGLSWDEIKEYIKLSLLSYESYNSRGSRGTQKYVKFVRGNRGDFTLAQKKHQEH